MPTPKKPTKLKNISVDEVSIVDEPATGRPFMFWKSAGDTPESAFEKKFKSLKVEFNSDGTTEGSLLKINGKDIGELRGLTLSAGPMGDTMSLYCSYTQGSEGDPKGGFEPSHTYTLSKADAGGVAKGESLSKQVDPDDISTLQAYMGELPPQLRRSMENLIGAVQSQGEPIEKEEEKTVPETKTQDGQEPQAVPVDLTGVTEKLDKLTEAVGAVAEKVTVLDTAETQRREAAEQAAKAAEQAVKEADGHEAAVEAGDEVVFDSEDDAIAAAANDEAIKDAEEGA